MLYLDTSLLVAALTKEAETGRMQQWLGQQTAEDLAISDWVATDFSSALSIKLRTGQIRAGDRAEALAAFARLATDSFTVVPYRGCSFARQPASRISIRLACAPAMPCIWRSAPITAPHSARSTSG